MMINNILLFAICLCFADLTQGYVFQTGVGFLSNANLTLAPQDTRFNYRTSTLVSVLNVAAATSIGGSASAGAGLGAGGASAETDGIVTVAYVGLGIIDPLYPTIWTAFYSASANATYGTVVADAVSADVSASAAFIGQVFEKLEELDNQGNVVRSVDLSTLSFTSSGVVVVDAARGLEYVTFTSDQSYATISLTVALSDVVGILNVGGVAITPTSVESYFEVTNYHWASSNDDDDGESASQLRLTVWVCDVAAGASAAASAADAAVFTAGNGATQVYAQFSTSALVNGSVSQSVSVTGMASASAGASIISQIPNASLKSQVSAAASASASAIAEVRVVQVTFPFGVSSFTYDPGMGFGYPQLDSGSSSTSAPTSGSSTSAPTSGSSTSAPTSGSSTSAPTSGSSTSAPTSGSSTSAPTSGSSTSAPTSGSSTSAPTSGSSTSAPTSGSSTSAPTSGSSTPAPTSGSSTSAPNSGSSNPTSAPTSTSHSSNADASSAASVLSPSILAFFTMLLAFIVFFM